MNKLAIHMNTVKSTVSLSLFAAIFAVALVVGTPFAHAQWDSPDGFVGDGGGCCSFDATPSYVDTVTPDYGGGAYMPDYSSSGYYGGSSGYSSSGYSSSGYSMPSFYGGASLGYSSTPFYASSPSFYPSPSISTNNGNTTNSYNPCATPNSCSTYDNGNTLNSNNTTNTTDACIYPGSCSTDNHSVVNANTTISSPTTVTVTNPPASQTQIVYQNPAPVYTTPTYYPQPTYYQPAPVYTQPVYHNPNVPYVTLSQVPYTGLDLGPIGTVIYWSFLVLLSLFGAYLIVVKRAYRNLAHSMKVFLFGSTDEQVTHEVKHDEVAPAPVAAPAPTVVDATDEFILSQIKRA